MKKTLMTILLTFMLALPTFAQEVSGTFTSTGVSGQILLKPGEELNYVLSGTFSATVLLEKVIGNGQTFELIESNTGAVNKVIKNDTRSDAVYRFNCSAFTSGTVTYSLDDLDDRIHAFTDKHGNDVLVINEDGINVVGSIQDDGVSIPSISSSQTLTNKTIDGDDNTIQDLDSTVLKNTDGAVKLARVTIDYTDLTGAGTGVAYNEGPTIPDNAIIKRAYYDVTTTFAGDGDDGSTISIGLEDQDNDVVVAVAISDGSNPWDAGFAEGIQDGTAANFIKHTAGRQLAVTWTAAGTDTTLSAGAMDVFVEYVVGN